MKISNVSDDTIYFDNGSYIYCEEIYNCHVHNYVDLEQLDELAFDIEFSEDIQIEKCDYGFRFGDDNNMFFIPCYSEQNGYYNDMANMEINYYKIVKITIEAGCVKDVGYDVEKSKEEIEEIKKEQQIKRY